MSRRQRSPRAKEEIAPPEKRQKRQGGRRGRTKRRRSPPAKRKSIKCDTLKELDLPEPLFNLLKQSWVEPEKPPTPPKPLTKEEQLKLTTAPIEEVVNKVPVRQRGLFFYKFVNELNLPDRLFRTTYGDRPWHEIKEDLEKNYGIKTQRQKKKNLEFGSFIAYRLDDWHKIKKRRDIFDKPEHAPIPALEMIRPREKLVIACFPERMVSRIYREVKQLRFEEEMTEEERLEQLMGFNPVKAPEKWQQKGRPPPGYRCHNCNSTEHYRHHCDRARRMAPTGIPKMFLEKAEDVDDQQPAYMLEDGTTVRVKQPPNTIFHKPH